MAVNLRDFDAFMNYDAEVSARRTKVALAVVAEKDETGVKRDRLAIIDLKQASIWQKIKLWWNESLERKTIGNYLSLNVQNWSKDISNEKLRLNWNREISNEKLRSEFELQCAKLYRKIIFTHKPEWKLEIKFHYPDLAHPGAKALESSTMLTFDRLTTNQEILNCARQSRFTLTTCNMQLQPCFFDIFEEHEVSGDFPTHSMGYFLKETDEGKDRTCTISFKEPSQQKLMEKIAQQSLLQGRVDQQREFEHQRALRQQMRAQARADEANAALTGAALATTFAAAAFTLGGSGHCHRHR